MPQKLENLLKVYREELEKVTDRKIQKVILYGSYARGDFRPDSDVDVMILAENIMHVMLFSREIFANYFCMCSIYYNKGRFVICSSKMEVSK